MWFLFVCGFLDSVKFFKENSTNKVIISVFHEMYEGGVFFFLMIYWQTPSAQCFLDFRKHKAISLGILSSGFVSVNMGKRQQKGRYQDS